MENEKFDQETADDGLYISSQTDVEDIKDFLKRRSENPVVINGVRIWDFCGYERDEDALEHAAKRKLRDDKYIIPFQVTGTWGYMFHLLPEYLKDAEILVYDPKRGAYNAYRNFSQELASEQEDAFRQDLAKRVADSEPDPLTFD